MTELNEISSQKNKIKFIFIFIHKNQIVRQTQVLKTH